MKLVNKEAMVLSLPTKQKKSGILYWKGAILISSFKLSSLSNCQPYFCINKILRPFFLFFFFF